MLLVPHSLAFIWVISFSSLIARAMFPLIFSFPDMNAMVGFSFPKMRNETENAALVPQVPCHFKNMHSKRNPRAQKFLLQHCILLPRESQLLTWMLTISCHVKDNVRNSLQKVMATSYIHTYAGYSTLQKCSPQMNSGR